MRRPSMPRPAHDFQPPRRGHSDALAAGFAAFLSTVYVLANRSPLAAALMVLVLWGIGIALYSVLSHGRWRLVGSYWREQRALLRQVDEPAQPQEATALGSESVGISDREQAEFAKLMGATGLPDEWPKQ